MDADVGKVESGPFPHEAPDARLERLPSVLRDETHRQRRGRLALALGIQRCRPFPLGMGVGFLVFDPFRLRDPLLERVSLHCRRGSVGDHGSVALHHLVGKAVGLLLECIARLADR
jgi:hypothetical protein